MTEAVRREGSRFGAYMQLLRPANIVTALADILAGFAASGAASLIGTQTGDVALPSLGWLLLSTIGLYGGGVVLNDVFDAELDRKERPERPIPSGRASATAATILGALLLLTGVLAAAMVSPISLALAFAVALWAVMYDAYGKHHAVLGPLNMGMCRGGNLLLGVSTVPAMVGRLWFLALLPVLYIAAITAVSRGEVHGGRRGTGVLALVLIAAVIGGVAALPLASGFRLLDAAPFLLVFALAVVPAFARAARDPQPGYVRTAVRTGVLSLILLNATLAAGFAGWMWGLGVAALLPVSYGLARAFAVT